VCWTDFFQGLLMMAALMLVPIVVYFGHSELLDPTALETVYEYTDAATGAVTQCAFGGGIFNASWQDIVSGLGWGLGYFGMPHILVRFMSIEKPSMIKKSSIVAIIWVVISLFSAVMIAYFGRMIMGEELLTHGNQKLVFIAMSRKFFPAGICGLLLAAIIAASISTADSQLLVASSSFTADLYKPFFRKGASEKETLLIGRVLVLVLSLIAFAIANSKGSGAQTIMDMVENAWGAFGSSFGPTILLSLFWKRFNYKGAVAGVVSGFVVDLGWLLSGLTASTGVYEIVPGFIVSFLAAYLVARFTEAPNAEAVAIFEEATKPDAD
jgi:sodium/proline symporter